MNPNSIPRPGTPTITIAIPYHGLTTDGLRAYAYISADQADTLAAELTASAKKAREAA